MTGTPRAVDAAQVVGREAEAARVDAWLAAVPPGARSLVLPGEPGIGKTTLWVRGLRAWRASGGIVLVTRPAEEEMPPALSGLVGLLEQFVEPVSIRAGDDPIARGASSWRLKGAIAVSGR